MGSSTGSVRAGDVPAQGVLVSIIEEDTNVSNSPKSQLAENFDLFAFLRADTQSPLKRQDALNPLGYEVFVVRSTPNSIFFGS